MPCEKITLTSGGCGFLCSRGRAKEPPKPCYVCGKPSTRLCDYRDGFTTCDQPMCDEHAHHHGTDTDYCEEHDNEFSKKRTAAENKRLGFATED